MSLRPAHIDGSSCLYAKYSMVNEKTTSLVSLCILWDLYSIKEVIVCILQLLEVENIFSILFVGYFVTPLLVQDLLRSYVVLPHQYAMYCL